MRRHLYLCFLLAGLAVTSATAEQQRTAPARQSPFRLLATVKQVMTAITIPASEVIFGAAARESNTDAEWAAIVSNALVLAESGNLLMLPGRNKDNGEWTKQSQDMIAAASTTLKAAQGKNVNALMEASDRIYGTCEGCHDKYMKKTP